MIENPRDNLGLIKESKVVEKVIHTDWTMNRMDDLKSKVTNIKSKTL